jgi:hypothetical protein
VERRESLIVAAFIVILVPVCLFFASWWLSVGIVPERYIPLCAFGGLALGAVLDLIFLAKWTARAYLVPLGSLMLLYIFISIVTYAVFMGVPVFNLVPGAVAGIYMGRRLRHAGVGGREAVGAIRRTGIFAAAVIGCAAAVSAFLALRQLSTGAELERMFDLNFSLTRPMLIGLITALGPGLVAGQYFLAVRCAWMAHGRQRDAEADA